MVTMPNWGGGPPFTLDALQDMIDKIPPAPPPIEWRILTAEEQRRTARDVPLDWFRPQVPAKANGRRGTRRAWKRRHPPHQRYTYREPDDILILSSRAAAGHPINWLRPAADVYIVTPTQFAALEKLYGRPLR